MLQGAPIPDKTALATRTVVSGSCRWCGTEADVRGFDRSLSIVIEARPIEISRLEFSAADRPRCPDAS